MIVYKTFEEIVATLEDYKYHRVVDDHRMSHEQPVVPTVLMRLKYYLMGEKIPLTKTVARDDVRVTHTSLYAHPEVATALRLRQLRIAPNENPFKDQ